MKRPGGETGWFCSFTESVTRNTLGSVIQERSGRSASTLVPRTPFLHLFGRKPVALRDSQTGRTGKERQGSAQAGNKPVCIIGGCNNFNIAFQALRVGTGNHASMDAATSVPNSLFQPSFALFQDDACRKRRLGELGCEPRGQP